MVDWNRERRVIAFDLDGVLCEEDRNYTYEGILNKKPLKDAIRIVNNIYRAGHLVTIYTSRNPSCYY